MRLFSRERIESKTSDQIIAMRAAGLLVANTLHEVLQAVRPGVSTGELDALAEAYIRDHGGTPSFLGYHGFPGSLCVSVNDEIVHGIPSERTVADGDLVSIDCGAIVDGWHGDAARSLIVGGRGVGSEANLALLDATEQALWAGIAALAVGRPLSDVGGAIEDSVHDFEARSGRRFGIVEDYVGHGIGTEMHMDPQVPNLRVSGRSPHVVDGTTVAIEPMLTLGSQDNTTLDDDWTVVTDDGGWACHWENTVAATTAGLWVLTESDGGATKLGQLGIAYAPLDT